MVMQSIFPPRREVLANFDWIDFVSATGYVVFDGFNAVDSTGDNYTLIDSSHTAVLTSSTYAGSAPGNSPIFSSFAVASGQDADLDFDLSPFQLPRTIEGLGIVRIPIAVTNAAAENVYVIARLKKNDVTIVSVQSVTDVDMAINNEYGLTMKLLIPRTHFKKGDYLRLTVEIWSSDTDQIILGHNPNDTAIADWLEAGNSRMTLAIPFKLDFM